jgi:hypothetical protein
MLNQVFEFLKIFGNMLKTVKQHRMGENDKEVWWRGVTLT